MYSGRQNNSKKIPNVAPTDFRILNLKKNLRRFSLNLVSGNLLRFRNGNLFGNSLYKSCTEEKKNLFISPPSPPQKKPNSNRIRALTDNIGLNFYSVLVVPIRLCFKISKTLDILKFKLIIRLF